MTDTIAATPTAEPTWTVRPPQPVEETREGTYRGLRITVREHGYVISGATFVGHDVISSRYWYDTSRTSRPSMDAIADAAVVAADELLAAGWHVHDWRQHDDGQHCTGCGAER